MSKDLAKEYKEAVLNDLPDLWSRIEAQLPDNVSEGNEAEKNEKPELKLVTPEPEKSVNTAAIVNAAPTQTKSKPKKKKIPSWVWIALPTVAVLILVILPITTILAGAGATAVLFNTKNAAATSEAAAPSSYSESAGDAAYADSFADNADYEAVDSLDGDFYYKDDVENAFSIIPEENESEDAVDGGEKSATLAPAGQGQGSSNNAGEAEEAQIVDLDGKAVANSCLAVTVDGSYRDGDLLMIEFYIIDVIGENNEVYSGFSGFSKGECFKAAISEDEEALQKGNLYYVTVYYVGSQGNDYWEVETREKPE